MANYISNICINWESCNFLCKACGTATNNTANRVDSGYKQTYTVIQILLILFKSTISL